MKNNKLALIIAYYIARFDKEALANLGYATYSAAFHDTATKLGVKPNYVKLTRDEFDPIFPWRRGWQRPMEKRILRIVEIFQHLNEPDLREIVVKVLTDIPYRDSQELEEITLLIQDRKEKNKKKKHVFSQE